jgi:hypothetical protein
MSSLFQDINRILRGETTPDVSMTYIIEDYESKASLDRVHMFEARRALAKDTLSKSDLARAMVQIAGTQSMTRAEADPDNAIIASAQLFRTERHLREAWQIMGKLIEAAVKDHRMPLKEMIGKYNDSQLDLLEMTLKLPWRLSYPSETKEVEFQDYAIPGQEHIFRGTDEMMDNGLEAPSPDDEVAVESTVNKLRRNRKVLNEIRGASSPNVTPEQESKAVEHLFNNIQAWVNRGTWSVVRSDWRKNMIIVRANHGGGEYTEMMITVDRH